MSVDKIHYTSISYEDNLTVFHYVNDGVESCFSFVHSTFLANAHFPNELTDSEAFIPKGFWLSYTSTHAIRGVIFENINADIINVVLLGFFESHANYETALLSLFCHKDIYSFTCMTDTIITVHKDGISILQHKEDETVLAYKEILFGQKINSMEDTYFFNVAMRSVRINMANMFEELAMSMLLSDKYALYNDTPVNAKSINDNQHALALTSLMDEINRDAYNSMADINFEQNNVPVDFTQSMLDDNFSEFSEIAKQTAFETFNIPLISNKSFTFKKGVVQFSLFDNINNKKREYMVNIDVSHENNIKCFAEPTLKRKVSNIESIHINLMSKYFVSSFNSSDIFFFSIKTGRPLLHIERTSHNNNQLIAITPSNAIIIAKDTRAGEAKVDIQKSMVDVIRTVKKMHQIASRIIFDAIDEEIMKFTLSTSKDNYVDVIRAKANEVYEIAFNEFFMLHEAPPKEGTHAFRFNESKQSIIDSIIKVHCDNFTYEFKP